jgi:hypothetical protein
MPPSTLPLTITGDDCAGALILDPSTQRKILKNGVRVARIASPKVAPRSGNEATKRLFLDQPAIAAESRSTPDAKGIAGLEEANAPAVCLINTRPNET